MSKRFPRRTLLKRAAATAGGAAATRLLGVPYLMAAPDPGAKLRTAVIGCANQGVPSLSAAVTENLVALVDVDENHLASAMKWIEQYAPDTNPANVRTYHDYREMFDKLHSQIDAVFIATPDHHHATAAMRAIKLGKAVYVEKPLAHSIDEVRRLTEAAKEQNVITQLGNQGHSGEGIRRLCEYIAAGAIGDVTATYSWAPTGRGGLGGRLPRKPVPPGLHWDEWLGPARYRAFHDELHPRLWRSWWEFGDGSVGDWGCHNLDGPFMALELGQPTRIESLHQYGGSHERFPLRTVIRWTFPERGIKPPVQAYWYDGYADGFDPKRKDEDPAAALEAQNRPAIVAELEKKYGRDLRNGGTIYVGTEGVMYTGNYCGSPRILPEEKHRAFPVPDKTLARVRGTHHDDFLRACKDGNPACSDFSYSGPLTEMVLLGCLALKAGHGRTVEWDAAAMRSPNLPELDRLIRREYRTGWTL